MCQHAGGGRQGAALRPAVVTGARRCRATNAVRPCGTRTPSDFRRDYLRARFLPPSTLLPPPLFPRFPPLPLVATSPRPSAWRRISAVGRFVLAPLLPRGSVSMFCGSPPCAVGSRVAAWSSAACVRRQKGGSCASRPLLSCWSCRLLVGFFPWRPPAFYPPPASPFPSLSPASPGRYLSAAERLAAHFCGRPLRSRSPPPARVR